jgi:hypothetical protein
VQRGFSGGVGVGVAAMAVVCRGATTAASINGAVAVRLCGHLVEFVVWRNRPIWEEGGGAAGLYTPPPLVPVAGSNRD